MKRYIKIVLIIAAVHFAISAVSYFFSGVRVSYSAIVTFLEPENRGGFFDPSVGRATFPLGFAIHKLSGLPLTAFFEVETMSRIDWGWLRGNPGSVKLLVGVIVTALNSILVGLFWSPLFWEIFGRKGHVAVANESPTSLPSP